MTARLAALGPSPDDGSAVLFADEPAIHHLGEQLRRLQMGDWTADLTHPPIAGGSVLRQLTVRATTHALRVGVEDEALVIAGQPAHLARLAEDLALYAEHNDIDEPGMHFHVDRSDYPADDTWMATDSFPLMVAGWVPES